MTYLPLQSTTVVSISRKGEIQKTKVTSKFVLSYEVSRIFREGTFGLPLPREVVHRDKTSGGSDECPVCVVPQRRS
jgi:hypothetical protein